MAEVIVRDVSKTFDEGGRARAVLGGVSLHVGSGQRVALVGRSGSGKSTLLNLIAGIDRPSAGSISVGGQVISALGERERTLYRRLRVGFVFQFFNLLPTLTVAENLRLPLDLAGDHGAAGRARAAALLAAVGLADRARAFPDQLSGGEQQRVAIARALVHSPSLLLADEPTGALDAESGAEVVALLTALSRQHGATVVMVTHSEDVARSADRVLELANGRIVEPAAGAAATATATATAATATATVATAARRP